MKHELHLLRRVDELRRGGRQLNRAAPPRQNPQPPPFKRNLTFFNILFCPWNNSEHRISKQNANRPRSRLKSKKKITFLPTLCGSDLFVLSLI